MREICIPQRSAFQKTHQNKKVDLYHLTSNGILEAYITNYGAKVVSLIVKDSNGDPVDVVLGHDTLEDYINSEEQYFGAICGRYANRIAKGKFTIDGEEYSLPINNGPNSLHGGVEGFNAKVWDVVEHSSNTLKLKYISPDGEEGYPGEVTVYVTYTVDGDKLVIDYEASTTKSTVLNLTNHSYFNLSGAGDISIEDHIMKINSKEYLPTDDTAIPYGAPQNVAGTPFDFTTPTGIGLRIDEPIDQLIWAKGYDHTYIIDKPEHKFGFCAEVSSPKTNISMSVYSSEPGVQVYTGNWMTGNMRGKGTQKYPARSAVCFETQHYPDSPNKPEYPSTELRPGKTFRSKTEFRFEHN